MEKTIYIPGDLVMTNGIPIGTKKGIVYQVTESNADNYAEVKDGNAFTELKGSVTLSNLKGKTIKDDGFLFCDSCAWVKDIVPIPLTPSILEKYTFLSDMPNKMDKDFVSVEDVDKALEFVGSDQWASIFSTYQSEEELANGQNTERNQ